jgi:hypothetical protein
MRYILNDSGYIEAVSFGCSIECEDKTCTEYTGTVPTDYETLAIWSETANINAYKIVDGNLTYDSEEDARLQTLWESQLNTNSGETNVNNYSMEEQVVGTWIDGKPLYRKTIYLTKPNNQQSYGIPDVDTIYIDVGHSWASWNTHELSYTLQRCNFSINKKQGIIWAETTGLGDWVAYVTLEYTKTTD